MGNTFKVRKLGGLLLLLLFVFMLNHFKILQPLDRIIYDSQIRFHERAPLDEIVIIAIDKLSLDEIGRWPWPRSVHAELLNKVSKANPKAVILDILFSESAGAEEDALLAEAVKQNGKVILPVAFEGVRRGLVENLPIPAVIQGVAGVGHVHRVLDLDAVSRRSYLFAGLSNAQQWPSIALETLWVTGQFPAQPIPENIHTVPSSNPHSQNHWVRSQEYLLPFVGKPGTFKHISYASVLEDDFDLSQLTDKFLLVGTTAIGLGDVLSTPVSGESNPMPGIEVIANELDALIQGELITETGSITAIGITLSVVLISFLLWNFLPPRYSLFCAAGLIVIIMLVDTWLLQNYQRWFAPVNLIAGVAIGYLGWVWGRLVETVKYLNSELTRLGNVTMPLLEVNSKDADRAFNNILRIDGFLQGQIRDHQNSVLFKWHTPQPDAEKNALQTAERATIEVPIERNNSDWTLDLIIDENKIKRADAQFIASQLATYYATESDRHAGTPVEFINSRIELVKSAYSKMHSMNDFVSEVIDQLYNGLVVTDVFGNVVLANRGVDKLLIYNPQHLNDLNVLDMLTGLKFGHDVDWFDVFSRVMFHAEEFVVEASNKSGQHLLLEVTTYGINNQPITGMVFNFVDVTALKETEQSRRELLAFLSHDLRSPLASLIATSDLAKLRPEYQQSENFTKSIKANAKRALQLADDFLALMRAESISKESFQPVNFNAIVTESIAAVEASANTRQINIEITQDPSVKLFVNGDRSVLERVLINLLSNAIKYSQTKRTIEVLVKEQHGQLYCSVKDQGFGIKEEDKEKVFRRFERISHENNADNAGTGLGLAFVKSSIERHNGRINLESSYGEGSCFYFTLPLVSTKTTSQLAA